MTVKMSMIYKLRFQEIKEPPKLNHFEWVHMDGLKISTLTPFIGLIKDYDVLCYILIFEEIVR